MSLDLVITKRTEQNLLQRMKVHYSKPKGFVGRNICYAIYYNNIYYGHIVGGSATKHLPNRHDFLGTNNKKLNNIVNNIFYNIQKVDGKYPTRNFSVYVVQNFVKRIVKDWYKKYGNEVLGFETLVELPRTGELYRRAGWSEVGVTKGYTCKRIGGKGTDSYSGKRIWDTNNLKPKKIFCLKIK